jgi:hypothetical protein
VILTSILFILFRITEIGTEVTLILLKATVIICEHSLNQNVVTVSSHTHLTTVRENGQELMQQTRRYDSRVWLFLILEAFVFKLFKKVLNKFQHI